MDAIENAAISGNSTALNAALLNFAATMFHEYTHYINDNMFVGGTMVNGDYTEESGKGFEFEVYGISVDEGNATTVYDRERDGNIQNLPVWTELMAIMARRNAAQ